MTTQHTNQELGKFEKVADIRDIWPTEPQNFTPWLAENMDLLNQALDLDLTADGTEEGVGDFSLDILASDGSGSKAIIENQYGRTDHEHLGKLLTYAAGHDASTLIWIAEEFRNEHRAALDLLNNRTDENTAFFGVRIEAWTIDGSRPAPRFDVVAAPNSWAKEVKKASMQGDEKYREFFQPLVESLRGDRRFPRKSTATAYSTEVFVSFRSIKYRSGFYGNKKHRVDLYIDTDTDKAKEIYDNLYAQKEDIETEIGVPLHWERLDNRKASRISIAGDGGIDDKDRHDEIREWMADYLPKFVDVFSPRLTELEEQGIL